MARAKHVIPEMKTVLPARRILLALLMLVYVAAPATAQKTDDNPANWCRNGLFPSDAAEFRLAKVGGNRTARIHFLNDDDGCPSPEVKCETKSYLITGDQVLVSRKYGSWVCAWYQPRKGSETVGWLPVESLIISRQAASPALEKWIGRWKYDDQTLNIRRDSKSGTLLVKGDAIWRGLGDNVHVGSVEAGSSPQGNKLILIEEECRVTLKLVGDYIVASDNAECGGANVRFNGVYRRER
ncbi:MAG: hypothetical protein LC754_06580 [Acidobacteria bacterium]|nr:hypothetical protein [Acidobacteriota bacterium]